MADNKNNLEPSEEIMYVGNSVPKFLRIIYVVFLTWAAIYFTKNSLPDLMMWLKK